MRDSLSLPLPALALGHAHNCQDLSRTEVRDGLSLPLPASEAQRGEGGVRGSGTH